MAKRIQPGPARRYFEEYWNRPEAHEGWPFAHNGNGYGSIRIDKVLQRTHRLSCERKHGPCPPGREAAHLCGVKSCFFADHLTWATSSENQRQKGNYI